jgi:hypothetical protein
VENGKDADFIVGQRLGYSDYCQMLSEKNPQKGLARAYSTEAESWQVAN